MPGIRTCCMAALYLLATHPTLASPSTAIYQVRFEADWSALTHPDAYPANAHFSALIGATHRAGADLWRPGELASPGIERMAEVGGTSTLASEAQALIALGRAGSVIQGGGALSPGSATISQVPVSEAFPMVSLVTMVAPSPDWFVGVHGLPLIANGQWRESFHVDLPAWDAGTDHGATFVAADIEAVPHVPIGYVHQVPLFNGKPLGRFVFTLLQSEGQPDGVHADSFDPSADAYLQ